MSKLEDLLNSATAGGPFLVAPSTIVLSTVDPLGLREINFDLMDLLFLGLNNVAQSIGPYVLMAWAWRRAGHIGLTRLEAAPGDKTIAQHMENFVDRIEMVYVWSQFLREARTGARIELPGRQALAPVMSRMRFVFDADWEVIRNQRRASTGLVSAVNYGPSLRSMGWIVANPENRDAYATPLTLTPVLDDFEARIGPALTHPLFNTFDEVVINRVDVEAWGDLWPLDHVTSLESAEIRKRLGGDIADANRRRGTKLLLAAWADLDPVEQSIDALRMRMGDLPDRWSDPSVRPEGADAWRQLQLRQLFRLTLEALFAWIQNHLQRQGPKTSRAIASAFLAEAYETKPPETVAAWLAACASDENPALRLKALETAFSAKINAAPALLSAVGLCLHQAPATSYAFELPERLPMARARQDAQSWSGLDLSAGLARMIDRWVLAQHTAASVARGLRDARSDAKEIMRLRIVMDEDGWALTPGITRAISWPAPTGDRLETAFKLLQLDRASEPGTAVGSD